MTLLTVAKCYGVLWAANPCRLVFADWDRKLPPSMVKHAQQFSPHCVADIVLAALVLVGRTAQQDRTEATMIALHRLPCPVMMLLHGSKPARGQHHSDIWIILYTSMYNVPLHTLSHAAQMNARHHEGANVAHDSG